MSYQQDRDRAQAALGKINKGGTWLHSKGQVVVWFSVDEIEALANHVEQLTRLAEGAW